MASRKMNKKYFFSVEGETELWYLQWLQQQINNSSNADNSVSFDVRIEKNPLKRVKQLSILGKTEIWHLSDYESDSEQHQKEFRTVMDQMKEAGFNITTDESSDVEVILCGFDRELTYKKLEDICKMLSDKTRNIDYFATNPDWVCPTDFGSVPDCGSMCQMLEIATGMKPYFIGKPQPDMALLSMKKTGFSKEETLVIGDRLYTDVACGVNAGVDSCFVLSGEGTMEDLKKYDVRPTYILEDIKELLRRI